MNEVNLSNIWKSLKEADSEILSLKNQYKTYKKEALAKPLPGRRSMFVTATEFVWPRVALTPANPAFGIFDVTLPFSMDEITQPVIMSGDGVYVVERISYEAYIQWEFDFLASTTHPIPPSLNKPRTRRDSLANVQNGLTAPSLTYVGLNRPGNPIFDFEWRLSIGSNDRSYSLDALGGRGGGGDFLSRKALLGHNYRQLEFLRPYFLDGNEFFTLTLKPTYTPVPHSQAQFIGTNEFSKIFARFVVSMVTIGHKVLGHGHRI